MASKLRYFDIGINLTDPMFHSYKDLPQVLKRAAATNVQKLLITGSSLSETKNAIELCEELQSQSLKDYNGIKFYSTAGVHPCAANEIVATEKTHKTSDEYLSELISITQYGISKGIVKAIGEIGLDYDRLHFTPADVQRLYFQKQLEIIVKENYNLPLFLHSRACHEDFIKILKPFLINLPKRGVVHSFTGTISEMQELIDLGFFIGINGCSLKTEENLELVKSLPLKYLILETDGPWCEIRPSHASSKYLKEYPNDFIPQIASPIELEESTPDLGLQTKLKSKNIPKQSPHYPFTPLKKPKFTPGFNNMLKSRCEPCLIGLVAEVVAGVKGIEAQEVIDAAWENSCHLFDV